MVLNKTLLARAQAFAFGKKSPTANSSPAPPPLPALCHVQLAVTALGPGLPKFQAYHTSIIVNGVEYSFSSRGISKMTGTQSHSPLSRNCMDTRVFNFGTVTMNAEEFEYTLGQFFPQNTYDLLRKNCNSFSDCALYYLTGCRLEEQYRFLESLGDAVDNYTGLVQAISGGGYRPNPNVDGFDKESVVRVLDSLRPRGSPGVGGPGPQQGFHMGAVAGPAPQQCLGQVFGGPLAVPRSMSVP